MKTINGLTAVDSKSSFYAKRRVSARVQIIVNTYLTLYFTLLGFNSCSFSDTGKKRFQEVVVIALETQAWTFRAWLPLFQSRHRKDGRAKFETKAAKAWIEHIVALVPTMDAATDKALIRFETLATEIILTVLNQVTDLPTLRSLINASPVAFRLFGEYGSEITGNVIASSSITRLIPEIIHLMAYVRSSELPIHSLDELQRRVIEQRMDQQRSHDAWSPGALPKSCSSVVLRSILACADRISGLASDCLEIYLARLAMLEPQVLVDERFNYRLGHAPHFSAIPAWKMRPEGRKFTPLGKIEPPSWVERQRAERALWRIQLFYDLKAAAERSMLDWSSNDLMRLQDLEVDDFYLRSSFDSQYEEMNTMIDYIEIVWARESTDPGTSYTLPRLSLEQLQILDDYHLPMVDKDDHGLLLISAPACSLWRALRRDLNSPLKNVSFDPFSKLGFALWSGERLASLGLMNLHVQGSTMPHTNHFFSWKTILSDEEIRDMERVNEEIEQNNRTLDGLN
ncbi:hypothetical protein VTL71DRAFT_15481 [Oculimacula yallundae]|uniref:Uncharacterized protein n=1 Tax=Oculimacula yallundae TaxID=86028 RepID=A0ABR4CIW8_9HELO